MNNVLTKGIWQNFKVAKESYIITALTGRFSALYLITMLTSVAYFLSVLTGFSFLSTILAFPAIYLAPGLILILLVSKGRKYEFRQLIVLSFFLSTIISVILNSTLISSGVIVCSFSIATIYLLLIFILIMLAVIIGRKPQMEASHLDYIFLCFSLVTYASLIYLFTSMPRLFTMDETTYIAWSRYTTLNGKIYPVGFCSLKSDLMCLIKGRFFWTLLISSFVSSTGLKAYQGHVVSTMFLPMIAVTSTLMIPEKFKENKFLHIVIFLLVLTNPLLLLFSNFALNDLAVVFYLLLAVFSFVKSFNQREEGKISISLYGLFFSLLTLLVAFLIKENIIVIFAMYVILILYILRYRLYKVSKTWRASLYALTLPFIAYEVFIDIPYVISVWFIKNEVVAMLASRFLFISPAELFLGLFIPTPWNPITIFSYGFYDYLHYIYRMLSPETLGLLTAATGITLPLVLTLEGLRRNIQTRILIYLSTITLWLAYLLYLSMNSFWSIPRYFLFMTPILIVISLATIYEVFSSHNITTGIALILPSIFLLWTQFILSTKKGGIYVSYGLPKLNWTGKILMIQFIAYIVLLLVNVIVKMVNINVRRHLFGKFHEAKVQKLVLLSLIITMFASTTYFSAYSLSASDFFKKNEAEITATLFKDIDLHNLIVVSNFHTYMRPYVPDRLLVEGYLFPPPITEEEFIDFLKTAPNNSLLVISCNPYLAWYEYANNYIKKYARGDAIPLDTKTEHVRVKLMKEVDGIKVYRIESPVQLHENNNIINVSSVRIYSTNATNVRLVIRANAVSRRRIFVIIGTLRFLKMLTADLDFGENEIIWDFRYRLEDRRGYGSYIAGLSKILIYDETGDLLYTKTHIFTLSGVYLELWLLTLTLLISGILYLSRIICLEW